VPVNLGHEISRAGRALSVEYVLKGLKVVGERGGQDGVLREG
jgi:hypothetical protein